MSDAPLMELPVSRLSGATADAFSACFGESLDSVLNLGTWHHGVNLVEAHVRLVDEIARAVATETEHQRRVRAFVVERLPKIKGCPPEAGYWAVPLDEIREVQQG